MQKMLLLLGVICSFICCNSNTNNQAVNANSADSSSVVPNCYDFIQNGDTIQLSIKKNGNVFSGNLLYHLKEKDRNKGTVNGIIKQDTLLADYFFSSEGKQSVRQVAFLKQQNNLIEGFGNTEEREGKVVFINPQALHFTGFLLTATACH